MRTLRLQTTQSRSPGSPPILWAAILHRERGGETATVCDRNQGAPEYEESQPPTSSAVRSDDRKKLESILWGKSDFVAIKLYHSSTPPPPGEGGEGVSRGRGYI